MKYSDPGSLNVFSSIPLSSAFVVPEMKKREEKHMKETMDRRFGMKSNENKGHNGKINRLTIQTQILEAAVGKVVFHDGHERGHLTEEQHFVVRGSQLWQDSIQHLKLP